MSGYLPDGCTQEDCDRAAMDDRESEPGDFCDLCGATEKDPCEPDCPRWKPPEPRAVSPTSCTCEHCELCDGKAKVNLGHGLYDDGDTIVDCPECHGGRLPKRCEFCGDQDVEIPF